MPFETLSIESRIESRLRELHSNCSFLAALDGKISQTRLNQAMRGHRRLDTADGNRLNELTLRLFELRDAFNPLPISFLNPEEVRVLLNIRATSNEIREIISKLFQ